ncbi:MAG: hypothetical protein ACK5N0_00860 [Synechococcaceae cyanobacterium]
MAILNDSGSLGAKCHVTERYLQMLNNLLATDFSKSPSDSTVGSTVGLLLSQLDLAFLP